MKYLFLIVTALFIFMGCQKNEDITPLKNEIDSLNLEVKLLTYRGIITSHRWKLYSIKSQKSNEECIYECQRDNKYIFNGLSNIIVDQGRQVCNQDKMFFNLPTNWKLYAENNKFEFVLSEIVENTGLYYYSRVISITEDSFITRFGYSKDSLTFYYSAYDY